MTRGFEMPQPDGPMASEDLIQPVYPGRQPQQQRPQPSGVSLPGTAGNPIGLLVVDDQAMVRQGFGLLLASYPYLHVLGEATNGLDAVEQARRLVPDVILMDIRMPVMDGIEATRRILADPVTRACRVIVLTTFELDQYVYDALSAGASGFLLKDIDPDDLVEAIKVVARGDALLAPSVTRRLIERFVRTSEAGGGTPADAEDAAGRELPRQGAGDDPRIASLTDREREVLVAIAHGLSNREIADELGISPATAKTHVNRIMGKLQVHDRAQLVIAAYESGLVVPGASS